MTETGSKIVKRGGSIVDFHQSKITNAIWKAAKAVGGKDKKTAQDLSDKVVEKLKKQKKKIPTIEDVQDTVESILIETGHAKTAKAYIIYRQRRAEVREEKKRVLEKSETDEVDKRFDLNALMVLKSRYLRKDEKGKLTETPKQLFTRIAVHAALPDLLHDPRVFDIKSRQKEHKVEEFDHNKWRKKLSIGKYKLNRYHLEALKRVFDRFSRQKQMKVDWKQFFNMLKEEKFNDYESNVDDFYNLMTERKFMPNTPAIANFGNPLGMGSACFVLDIEDKMESIMETLKNTALVFKSGGGMGYNFSKIRPEGDFVSTTSGIASGPLSFMSLFDRMTEVIKQGGIRRGANMGILNSNHPDIEKFIKAKEGNKALTNFNISVLIMPDFWDHYNNNTPYPLVNPRNGETVKTIDPKRLFDMIVYQAWESAEPGVIFFDKVNDYNPFFEHLGPIVTTNPCGEVLLYGNEPCNLGSINVWAFFKEDDSGKSYYDWDALKETTLLSTRFLDNVIDINNFPLKQIEEMSLSTRKIGLGVMGVGDLLYELRLPYNSEKGRKFMEKLMEFVNYYSKIQSIEIAKERGPLPFLKKSFYPEGRLPISGPEKKKDCHFDWDKISEEVKKHGIRNGYTTIIAPTGSISMIAGCSSGVEPIYSLIFEKNVKVGNFYYIDPVFEKVMKEYELHDSVFMEEVAKDKGSIQNIRYVPPELKESFVTAMDISPEDHIRALAAFQKWTDSSISKTNNFPAEATVEHMRESYILAYELGCKDVTVYRDSSIKEQVLVASDKSEKKSTLKEPKRGVAAETPTVAPQTDPVITPQSAQTNGTILTNGNKIEQNPAIPALSAANQALQPQNSKIYSACPECGTSMAVMEGCQMCYGCGFSPCK